MTTATATAEKTVFKRETLELKNIHVYTQNDRINQDSRVGDRAYDKGLVKDILFSPMLWATPEFSSSYVTQIQIKGTRIYDSLCSYTGVLWSSFFGHADQMVGLCTGGQLGGRAGQRFVLCG
ncbi:hypothetical protein [Acinetobacter seifertii]|uniref:hypothetical protein n=1 Tax=Acinetobacter seifertii TaxID=1530123 RepID=UPI003F523E48